MAWLYRRTVARIDVLATVPALFGYVPDGSPLFWVAPTVAPWDRAERGRG